MEALRVEGLSKDFGGVHALRDVSFSVQTGEKVAIIGPNGAGKTTLLNMLNGQLSPTSGRVYLSEQDITHMTTYRRTHMGIARSLQITSLFFNLTVLDNVLIALHGTKPSRYQIFQPITGYKDLLTRAEELLEVWALCEKRNEPVASIAHGEQRRLEIALSLASEPRVLLLDEPSAGLTAEESSGIIEMIHKLGTAITVVFVAHDMDLVFGLAERIIVLHYGQIIAEGTPGEIQADPRVREIYIGMEEDVRNAGAG